LATGTITIINGSAAVTVSEPVAITVVSGDGVYDPATKIWTVATKSGSTVKLVLKATNNGDTGYDVSAAVTPAAGVTNVTASWSPEKKWLAPGGNCDFTLTVKVASIATPGVANFIFKFTR
jgi:hypothetical protein